MLLEGTADIAAGRCGEPVKLNLGDVGYYRVRNDAAMQAALARVLPSLAPADRVNLLADAWALIEAGRSPPAAFFDLADRLAGDDNRTVAEQVMRTFRRGLAISSTAGRDARRSARSRRRRCGRSSSGWDGSGGRGRSGRACAAAHAPDREALAISTTKQPSRKPSAGSGVVERRRPSLPPNLRGPVIHLAGRAADRATYDTLLGTRPQDHGHQRAHALLHRARGGRARSRTRTRDAGDDPDGRTPDQHGRHDHSRVAWQASTPIWR